jgi:hypothetical protein
VVMFRVKKQGVENIFLSRRMPGNTLFNSNNPKP